MRYRKLQIAIAATFGIAGLLSIALCVRSYWRDDICGVTFGSEKRSGVSSSQGYVTAIILDWSTLARVARKGREWDIRSEQQPYLYPNDSPEVRARKQRLPRYYFPSLKVHDGYYRIILPHYSIVMFCAALATAPLLKWRFSLLTLLMAMTVMAVLTGLAICN